MFNLKNLLSQYELLVITASHLSTVDLYRVALTCSELQELILKPRETFNGLKRYALCDGAGIKARQNYRLPRPDWYDPCPETEIEVHIFNLECDNTERLPCIKCGINVCEECRSYPRLGDGYGPCRLPHYSVNGELENVICYCDKCDREVEKKFGGELCKCDRYARWICKFCEWKESEEVSWYCDRTKLGEIDEEGMAIFDHQCWKLVSASTLSLCISLIKYIG